MMSRLLNVAKRLHPALETHITFGRDPKADLSLLEQGLGPRSRGKGRGEETARRILKSYHLAKAAQKEAPASYQPGGTWNSVIKSRRAEYLDALAKRDICSLHILLENFFRNSGVIGLVNYGYYADISQAGVSERKRFVNNILADLAVWRDFVRKPDTRKLTIPNIGNPWGYVVDDVLLTSVSCKLHYYADRVHELLADVRAPVVAEIGGGFGGFAYYLLSSGRPSCYVNFDLPEVLLIMQYFLIEAFPNKKILLFGEQDDRLLTPNTLERYDIILMPNFELPRLAPDSADLFMNTCSLSEMDYSTVEEYVAQISRACRLYFFHENNDRRVLDRPTGHVEVSSSTFPIPLERFRRIYKADSLWSGRASGGGVYREHLYQRR